MISNKLKMKTTRNRSGVGEFLLPNTDLACVFLYIQTRIGYFIFNNTSSFLDFSVLKL